MLATLYNVRAEAILYASESNRNEANVHWTKSLRSPAQISLKNIIKK
jgi:hypothetical protein